jgi:hypothetical protein
MKHSLNERLLGVGQALCFNLEKVKAKFPEIF